MDIRKDYFSRFNKLCTEFEERYAGELPSNELLRILKTINLFPNDSDIQTVLDVGCRDGRLLNLLGERYETMGMDIGEESLQKVRGMTRVGSIDEIPFQDKSFDLTLCTEVLEHLPDDVMYKGIEELKRVTKKYIIVSVPHEENLVKGYIQCDQCRMVHHESGHLRSFSHEGLLKLFTGWKEMNGEVFGEKEAKGMEWLYHLLHYTGNGWCNPTLDLCPYCGHQNMKPRKRNVWGYLLEHLIWRLDKWNPYWVHNKMALVLSRKEPL